MNVRLLVSLFVSALCLACGEVPVYPKVDASGSGDGGGGGGGGGGGDAAIPDASEVNVPFTISVATQKVQLLPGATSSLSVSVVRNAPFTGAVVVSAADLPSGVTAAPTTIASDQTTGSLVLTADPAAPHSLPTTITITGAADTERATTVATVTVHGPPGELDRSFAGSGMTMIGFGANDDYANAMVVQPDGKIVVAGSSATSSTSDFAVVRLDRDGTLDATFGQGGKVVTDFGGYDTANGIALQADGKIVVVGRAAIPNSGSGVDFAVARYLPDGSPDPTFSGDGKVTTALGTDVDVGYAVVVQPDGRIVVGGSSNRGLDTTGVDFALTRYMPDGSLDTTFGSSGVVITSVGSSNAVDSIYALALQQIGGQMRILAAGGDGNFELARYRDDGALDTSFGSNGKVATVFSAFSSGAARAIVVTPENRIFAAGHVAQSFEHKFAVAGLTAAGQLDPNFGPSIVAFSGSNWNEAYAIALDVDKPVVAGSVYDTATSSANFALVRFQTNGAIDTTFGGGRVITPVAPTNKPDSAAALALQIDERVPTVRVLAAGRAQDANYDFAVVRYWK